MPKISYETSATPPSLETSSTNLFALSEVAISTITISPERTSTTHSFAGFRDKFAFFCSHFVRETFLSPGFQPLSKTFGILFHLNCNWARDVPRVCSSGPYTTKDLDSFYALLLSKLSCKSTKFSNAECPCSIISTVLVADSDVTKLLIPVAIEKIRKIEIFVNRQCLHCELRLSWCAISFQAQLRVFQRQIDSRTVSQM